jgi:hypothetical protein
MRPRTDEAEGGCIDPRGFTTVISPGTSFHNPLARKLMSQSVPGSRQRAARSLMDRTMSSMGWLKSRSAAATLCRRFRRALEAASYGKGWRPSHT